MKKHFIVTTICAILTSALFAALPLSAEFPDINQATSINEAGGYMDAVRYVERAGIVNGYPDGTYKPQNKINRAEFTKIIINAFYTSGEIAGCDKSALNKYSDVPKEEWFAPFICIATSLDIIQGYPDGTFKPGQDISFVEAAKIISITASINGTATLPLTPSDPWYRVYVNNLASGNAIPLDITEFNHKISRGEMAEIIYRVLEKITNKPSQTYNTIDTNTVQSGVDLQVGQKKGDFTVTDIRVEQVTDTYTFSGKTQITGIVDHYESGLLGDIVCVHDIIPSDRSKLPTLHNREDPSFCLLQEQSIAPPFDKPGSYGQATITISGYETRVVKAPSEGLADSSHLESIDEIFSQITPIDSEWNLFENFTDHYSFKIPKTSYSNASCSVAGTEDGQNYFDVNQGNVEIRAYSTFDSDSTFFAEETAIIPDDYRMVQSLNQHYPFNCNYYYNSHERLANENRVNDPYSGARWEVIAQNINDEQQDIDAFIKSEYGSGCGFEGLSPTSEPGTFDVEVSVPEDPFANDCFVNYVSHMKYSPDLNKLIKWNIGQDFNFAKPPTTAPYTNDGYDTEMSESFRFIK